MSKATVVIIIILVAGLGYLVYESTQKSTPIAPITLIRVNTPQPEQVITSPLLVEGEARGTWFFEGDFPVKLLDENDNVMAIAIAQAQSEWMTEDFVSFRVEIEFSKPFTNRGTLVLEKDNPSGLPEHADELRVPIFFKGR